MTPLYTAVATATGGREGKTRSDDGIVDLPLTVPKSMGGPGGEGTNPEQLFAAGYAACFGSALRVVAAAQKKRLGQPVVTAHVTIGKEGEGFKLAVELVGAFPELTKEEAAELMTAAHQVCPYSKATRGNIDVKLSVA